MSGHSHSKNIMGTKSIQDSKRSNLFAKFSRDIYIAAKFGGDINNNPLLRDIVKRARESSMQQIKIQNAIDKASGKIKDNIKFVEKIYEVYGVGGLVTLLIECNTDNPNRTLSQIKEVAFKFSAKMVPEGSISWDYKEVTSISLKINDQSSKNETILNLFEVDGVEDVLDLDEDKLILIIKKDKSNQVIDQVKKINKGIGIMKIEIKMMANKNIELEDEIKKINEDLIEALYTLNEVEEIWSNFN